MIRTVRTYAYFMCRMSHRCISVHYNRARIARQCALCQLEIFGTLRHATQFHYTQILFLIPTIKMHVETVRLARSTQERVARKKPLARFFPGRAAELGLSRLSWVSFSVFTASCALNRRTNANTQKTTSISTTKRE